MAFVITGLYIIGWAIVVLLQRHVPSLATFPVGAVLLLYCIGVHFVQMASGALRWVTRQVAGPLMADIVTGAVAPLSVDPADVVTLAARGFSLTLVPLLLWFGFVNHTSSERTARRMVQQIAWIALLITSGIILVGGVLAFYELRSR